MDLSEWTSEVEAILGKRADLETRIHMWANIVQKRVARLYPFQELRDLTTGISTVSGQKTYSLTTDLGITDLHTIATFRLIQGVNSWKLRYVPSAELDKEEANPTEYGLGKPRRYTRWGDSIDFVDYVPDDSYTVYLRYLKWPEELNSDSDESELVNKDDLLIAATCSWGYKTLQEDEDSTHWANVTSGIWGDILKDLQNNPDYVPKMKGFKSAKTGLIGEYWNNPFIRGIKE